MLEKIDTNIIERNNENNNTLSIIDESQSKEKTEQIKSKILNRQKNIILIIIQNINYLK